MAAETNYELAQALLGQIQNPDLDPSNPANTVLAAFGIGYAVLAVADALRAQAAAPGQ